MNEAKQIAKDRKQRVVRRDSRLTAIAVWGLVVLEVFRLADEYGVVEWLLTLN
jgi:hypothetical protein